MRPIIISSVNKQRYDTVGDWYKKNGKWIIKVSKTKTEWEWLIAVHELIEMILCEHRKIKEADVTKFDLNYTGKEPGASKKAPYYREHAFATKVERMLAKQLNIKWRKYL